MPPLHVCSPDNLRESTPTDPKIAVYATMPIDTKSKPFQKQRGHTILSEQESQSIILGATEEVIHGTCNIICKLHRKHSFRIERCLATRSYHWWNPWSSLTRLWLLQHALPLATRILKKLWIWQWICIFAVCFNPSWALLPSKSAKPFAWNSAYLVRLGSNMCLRGWSSDVVGVQPATVLVFVFIHAGFPDGRWVSRSLAYKLLTVGKRGAPLQMWSALH